MENLYLYIRYSTDKQEDGSSYDRQLKLARQQYPAFIADDQHIYFDAGKSAYKGEQLAEGGELRRFRDDMRSGKVPTGSTLLVEDLDRLSRADMWEASENLRDLTENGITVVTLRDGQRYSGKLNLSSGLMSLIKQELAHDESRKKAGRVADSYVLRYAAARAGKKVKVLLPSWLEWVGDYEPYKVKEAEKAIVKEIFDRAAEGYSYAAIAKMLNQRGVKPFRSKKDGDGKLWITASLYALIRNEAVLGTYKPNDGGPPLPLYFPPIIEKSVFDAAQGVRVERKRAKETSRGPVYNLWTRVGVCALCGRAYHCLPKGKAGHVYLVCSGKIGGACKAGNIRADKAEIGFREVLLNAVNADYFLEDNREELMKARELEGQIDAVDRKRQTLLAMLEDDPMPEIAAALKKINSERAVLTEQKAALDQAAIQRVNLSRSREALQAKIDLSSNTARMEANSVLRRLKISVEIQRQDPHILYTIMQDGKLILKGRQTGDKAPPLMAYTKETAVRAYELGDTLWPELAIEKPFKNRTNEGQQLSSTEPGPDWSNYDEPLHEHDYVDEYTPTGN
ncbi:recombinase family protein [Massilia sp. CT11-137]|uniref:recombinase family protein n=1 Tax=Massilia sp. CT11-137 TaxID=3393901 RepID=UPI0039A68BE3